MNSLSALRAIVVRDLLRALRQKSRVLGGVARPFMWLFLVGAGYNTIARIEGASSYQAFVFPGVVVMAVLFGGMLTAISTVYDREFGMLRLMLASPASVPAILAGRALAAAVIGGVQGGIVLVCAPLLVPVSAAQMAAGSGALVIVALSSAVLGLLVAAPLRSVENYAGIVNVVLFPLLFLSGALYPTGTLPPVLRIVAVLNPVTYGVDLMRHAFAQPAEFSIARSLLTLIVSTVVTFGAAALLFDPERRLLGPRRVPAASR